MPKYIDAEYKYFPTKYTHNDTDYAKGWNACLNSISQQPTADVQEVKHGKWIDYGWHPNSSIEGSAHFYKCSICAHKQIGVSEYCPHCGARMDGDDSEQSNV